MTREQLIEAIRHSLDMSEAADNVLGPINWNDYSDYELHHWYNEIHFPTIYTTPD